MNTCVYSFPASVLFCLCICPSVCLCVCMRLGGWVHVCGGQAVPMKWVTWPMHTVAEGFLSSFLSDTLSHLPSQPFSVSTRAWASVSALIFVRCIQKHTRVCGILQEESETCRANYRGNSRGSHGAGEPSVNAEGDTLRLWGGTRT